MLISNFAQGDLKLNRKYDHDNLFRKIQTLQPA